MYGSTIRSGEWLRALGERGGGCGIKSKLRDVFKDHADAGYFFKFFFELWSYSSDTRRIDELGTQIIVELGIWTPTTVSFRYGEKRRENSRFPSLRTGAYILPYRY